MHTDEILEYDSNSQDKQVRTGLLTTASILSWIWGGLMILVLVFAYAMKSMFVKLMNETADKMDEQSRKALEPILENFDIILLIYMGAYVLSIVSVILMFRLKKIGFYIYAPLHVIMTFYPYVYQPFVLDEGAIFNIAILGTFLAFYGVNLKHMD